jgi:hypothetical protein
MATSTLPGQKVNYNSVAEPSKLVLKLREDWDLVSKLLGGTTAMREASTKYLPKWPNEDDDSYSARLKTATLFPAFKRTAVTLSARPFSKPVTVGEDVPPKVAELLGDVTTSGINLDTFASDVMFTAMAYGLCGILTEYPVRPVDAVTIADEKAAKLRPYMAKVHPESILGWRHKNNRLTQLRIMELLEEDDGPFGTKEVKQVRVLEPGKWTTFRQDSAAAWMPYESGVSTMNEIPFVPIYGERISFMVSKSALIELAHLNIKHWQSQSDQDTLIHVARVPILTATGVDKTFKLTVGSSAAVKLPQDATLGYTEHSGAAIGSGKISLDDLKEDMRQAGAELLVLKSGPVTATEVSSDNAVGMCALQEQTLALEDGLDSALQFFAEWMGLPEGGHVTLFKDFGAATLAEASAQLLVGMANSGKLSNETLILELKRRGIVGAEVTWEDEKEKIDQEGPPVGKIDPLTGLPYDKPMPPAGPSDPEADPEEE